MCVNVAASRTFNGVSLKIFSDEQGLDFSHFQRAQYASQTGDAPGIAASLGKSLTHQLAAAFGPPLIDNLLGVSTNFVSSGVREVSMEAAEQRLAHIWVQLRFQEGPMRILARKNPFFENAFFQ